MIRNISQLLFMLILFSSDERLTKCLGLYRFPLFRKPCYKYNYPCPGLPTSNKPYHPTASSVTNIHGPKICKYPSMLKHLKRSVICRDLTEIELEQNLKNAGGYVPRYVALKEKDICNFKDLTKDYLNEHIPKSEIQANVPRPRYYFWRKRRFDEVSENSLNKRSKRAVSVGTITRDCYVKGARTDFNLYRLCSECPATTTLKEDRFPRFINEVICNERDRNAYGGIGRCIQRVIKLNFLLRTDQFEKDEVESTRQNKEVYKRVWRTYTQDIRTCCECQLYQRYFNTLGR